MAFVSMYIVNDISISEQGRRKQIFVGGGHQFNNLFIFPLPKTSKAHFNK